MASERMELWKFDIAPGATGIHAPEGARPVHLGAQRGQVVVWCEVDPYAEQGFVEMYVIGTGWPIPEGTVHVCTLIAVDEVWHLYTPEAE